MKKIKHVKLRNKPVAIDPGVPGGDGTTITIRENNTVRTITNKDPEFKQYFPQIEDEAIVTFDTAKQVDPKLSLDTAVECIAKIAKERKEKKK